MSETADLYPSTQDAPTSNSGQLPPISPNVGAAADAKTASSAAGGPALQKLPRRIPGLPDIVASPASPRASPAAVAGARSGLLDVPSPYASPRFRRQAEAAKKSEQQEGGGARESPSHSHHAKHSGFVNYV